MGEYASWRSALSNFNQAIAGVRGLLAAAARTICDTLLVPSLDEASTHYGLIAEAVSHPPSFASTSFRLRAAARHHDGNPITVDDVIYSFEAYRKYNRFIGAFYRHVLRVEQSGEREVTFTFDAPGNREMPVILGQLRVLPKHWWEGNDASGRSVCTVTCLLKPAADLFIAYCGSARNSAIYPTQRSATCRARTAANSPIVATCIKFPP